MPLSIAGRYRSGYRFELAVKKYLEKHGWYVVRSAGSHGAVDLVAIRNGTVLLIQCKLRKRIPEHTINQLRRLALPEYSPHLQPVYAYKERRYTFLRNLWTLNEVKVDEA